MRTEISQKPMTASFLPEKHELSLADSDVLLHLTVVGVAFSLHLTVVDVVSSFRRKR